LNLSRDTIASGTLPPNPGSTFEGEVATAVDAHPNRGFVYSATIEAVLAPATGAVPTCIVEKQIRVYRSKAGGPPITDISSGLPLTAALGGTRGPVWFTDPWLAIGPDGTVFLSALFTQGSPNCSTGMPNATGNFQEEIQLWVLDPTPGATFRQVATAPDPSSPGATMSQISAGFNELFGSGGLDHSRMAANPRDANEVVVTFLTVNGADQVRTIRRDSSGAWNVVDAGLTAMPEGRFSFSNPAYDPDGHLYIAHALPRGPVVRRFDKNSSGDWVAVAAGGPTTTAPVNASTRNFIPGTTGLNLPVDPTPALAVGRLGGNAQSVVYMAYTIDTAGSSALFDPITPGVEFSAANVNNLEAWLPPSKAGRALSWAQDLDFDGNANVLDLVYFSLDSATPTVTTASVLNTYHERHSAGAPGTPFLGPQQISANGPRLVDIPIRSPQSTRLFPGEYNGVATLGERAFFAWPEIGPAGTFAGSGLALPVNNIDLGQGLIDPVCPDPRALTLSRPDTLWDCDCACGGFTSSMIGCATAGVTNPADACPSVCIDTDCGTALTCATARQCAATSVGRAVAGQSCNRAFGPASGSQPSFFADYYATALSRSTARFNFEGDSASTRLGGAVAFNVGTSPPEAGARIEIARLQLSPSSFGVGGFIGATVRNIRLVHAERFHGQFTDASHFVIPAGRAEFVVDFTVDPDGPSWLTGDDRHRHLVVSNSSDIMGTLDLAAGTIELNVTFGDANNGFNASFVGTVTAAPVDSDGDGIVDAADNCPLVPNPDQTDEPPVFTGVVAQHIEICTAGESVIFTPPTASDVCTPDELTVEGVVISINGVAQNPGIFLDGNTANLPAGRLVVEWTATDGNGNRSTATQVVEVVTRPVLYANGAISIADRVAIRAAGGLFGTVDNSGSGEVDLGVESTTGDVLSVGRVFMRNRSHVRGLIKTGAELVQQTDTTVDGTIEQFASFVLPTFPALSVAFPANAERIDLQPDQVRSIAPAAYADVAVKSRATLRLTAGTYYFEALTVEPSARIELDKSAGPVHVYVQKTLTHRGAFVHSNGSGSGFTLDFAGTSSVYLEAAFEGIVRAPEATLVLGSSSPITFTGEFAARQFEVRPDATVLHDPFECEQSSSPL
jgi:hypothetical protein